MTVTLCVMLWARVGREPDLAAYEDTVLPFVADHGGRVLQRARTHGERDEPNEVHFLQFPSEDALDAYIKDPRRSALASERDQAIERTQLLRVELIV